MCAYRTTTFPPPRTCSTVFGLTQLLENQRPPFLLHTVMPIVSSLPGSPLSVIVTCSDALPSTGIGALGFVMSWMLALPLNVAVPGFVAVATVVVRDVIELPLIW